MRLGRSGSTELAELLALAKRTTLPSRTRSRSYSQAGSLRQSDLILVEGEQKPRFEMNRRGNVKNIQRSVSSSHGVP